MTSSQTAATEFVLDYLPPFDWAAARDFMGDRAVPGVEWCDDGAYGRTFALAGSRGTLSVAGDGQQGVLTARVRADGPLPREAVRERLRRVFDLDVDPAAVGRVLGADAQLGPLFQAGPGLRVPGAWDPFEQAVRAILGQQVTVAAARTLATRLVQRWGVEFAPSGAQSAGHLFPTADALADADVASIGMPGRRGETIRVLARAVAAGDINLDPTGDWAALRAALLELPGIGEWTVGYLRLRALKDRDAFPHGDIALLRAAQRLGIAQTQAELARAAEAWRPWRAYAVLHLWRSLAA